MLSELRQILRCHAEKYPLMQPQDCVKLIYQNEFGCGHLIADEASCLAFLHQEYAATEQSPDAPLLEDLGNGMVRVMLRALDAHDISPDALGDAFLHSAPRHTGTAERFAQKLDVLRELTAEDAFSFTTAELEAYLSGYIAAGCPAASHSESYRKAYRPAYRIICKDLVCR